MVSPARVTVGVILAIVSGVVVSVVIGVAGAEAVMVALSPGGAVV